MVKSREILNGERGGRRLDDIAAPLAEVYKAAFAGEPWYEVSRCAADSCSVGFCPDSPGTPCVACGSELVQAYKADELVATWRKMITEEDAMMEVGYLGDSPVRVTLARPTNPSELFERKYADVPAMKNWTEENLDQELVWIEDTFADRNKQPRGNLKDRGRTLGSIALRYGGLAIVTRTLAPQIIAATLRDIPDSTSLFIGTDGAGGTMSGARQTGSVPDRRTLLNVKLETGE
jgi:hypothetical protein